MEGEAQNGARRIGADAWKPEERCSLGRELPAKAVDDGPGKLVQVHCPSVVAEASPGANDVATNMTTFAPMSAFSAVETGPGPKENEEACEEG